MSKEYLLRISTECIKKLLAPFIEKYHKNWQNIVGPAHVYEQYPIIYIKLKENVANLHELRHTERFWYQMKQKVCEIGLEAKNTTELEVRGKQKLCQFTSDHFEKFTKVR